jgi:hypothetical protein
VRFAFESEPITAGMRCNCSICQRRGALMSAVYYRGLEIEGADALTAYVWGDRMMKHHFCRTCGIATFSEVIDDGRYRVNLGCVEGIEPLELPHERVDGRSF